MSTWRNPDGDMEGEIEMVPDYCFQCLTCDGIFDDDEMHDGDICLECKEREKE